MVFSIDGKGYEFESKRDFMKALYNRELPISEEKRDEYIKIVKKDLLTIGEI